MDLQSWFTPFRGSGVRALALLGVLAVSAVAVSLAW
jgi:hypothetical protein